MTITAIPSLGAAGGPGGYSDIVNTILQGLRDRTLRSTTEYGVDPDADDNYSFLQDAIEDATGPADPATNIRVPRFGLWTPSGTYKLSQPPRFESVQGFPFLGSGSRLTVFQPTGAMDQAFDINGSAWSLFKGFSVSGGAPAHAIELHWDGMARSTTQNMFEDVYVNGSGFDIGFAIGVDNALQVDGTVFKNCQVVGNYPTGDDQIAWQLGNGTYGNNLIHYFEQCNFGQVKNGLYCDRSNFHWRDGAGGGCDIDFLVAIATVCSIKGFGSEQSNRMLDLTGAGTGGATGMTLEDFYWHGTSIDPDGEWMRVHGLSGYLGISNGEITQTGAVTPKIAIDEGVYAGYDLTLDLAGFRQQAAIDDGIDATVSGSKKLRVIGRPYQQIDSGNAIVASQPFVYFDAGPGTRVFELGSGGTVGVLGKTLSFGANDSAGSGFKQVRVPN